MAELERPVLPPQLYRYRKLSDEVIGQEIEAIRDRYLWCSQFRCLNDPMEGYYRASTRLKKYTEFDYVASQILSAKVRIGICSLSDTCDNELMWAHYASNYSGICVGYRPRRLLASLPSDVSLVRLGYDSAPPEIGIHDSDAPPLAARKILSHKKASWAYEREWRILGPQGKLPFQDDCIAEIRLGKLIERRHKDQLLEIARAAKIRVLQMSVKGYEHEWERVNPGKQIESA